MYFSCVLQEKYQKKQAKGALNARRSRTGAAPFGNPRRTSPLVPEHLNLNPVQAENLPIFCLKFTSVNIAGRRERQPPPTAKPYISKLRSLRCWAVVAVRPGRVHRGGAPRSESKYYMIASGNHTVIHRAARSRGKMKDYIRSCDRLRGQRLPYASFFGYFLVWYKKVTHTTTKITDCHNQ